MGLFSLFKKNSSHRNGQSVNHLGGTYENGFPEIPEKVFIEKDEIKADPNVSQAGQKLASNIDMLFEFLEKNYEELGYNDALRNPDASHMEQNVEAIQNQLQRVINRVKTFYEDFIKEINFHIDSRSRSGMVDTVEELKMKKDIAESHISKVIEIETDSKNGVGDSQGILIGYRRGFRNGLAAISNHAIMNKKL